MSYIEIENLIKAQIRNNGEKAITGQVLQDVLLAMIAPQAEKEAALRHTPMTFTALSSGTFAVDKSSFASEEGRSISLQYSKNGGAWASALGVSVECVAGDTIALRGDNESIGFFSDGEDDNVNGLTWEGMTGNWKVSGNVMSLLSATAFATLNAVPDSAFSSLFEDYNEEWAFTGLRDASELLLPATTLAPICYGGMFGRCTGLTSAPELPATTLAPYCYASMFKGCTGLTSAPALPAPILAPYCYADMFTFCTNLAEVRCHATNIAASGALAGWLDGVANTGIFYKDAGVTYPAGDSGIPVGWTIQNL